MRTGLIQSLAVLVSMASGCATTHEPTGGPEAAVQLQVPEVVAWEPDGPQEITLSVVNYSRMILMAAMPKTEASDVTVYDASGKVRCKTPVAVQKTYEKYEVQAIQVGQRWEIKRDLKEYCGDLAPGVYRYEANYRMNYAEALRSLYVAFLGPQGGKILVRQDAAGMKYEDLVAAVEHPEVLATLDAEEKAAAQPQAAQPGEAQPAGQVQPAAAPPPESAGPVPSAAEIRACVDKELADRGLNAYGDAKGTRYESGRPPVDEFGRILYVASRNPGIRKACKVPRF